MRLQVSVIKVEIKVAPRIPLNNIEGLQSELGKLKSPGNESWREVYANR